MALKLFYHSAIIDSQKFLFANFIYLVYKKKQIEMGMYMEAVKEYFSDFFAAQFDEYRKKSDGTLKTLDEAADEIGISKGALSQYLNGLREPKISSLMKIALVFKVSPNKLLGYQEENSIDTRVTEIHAHTGLSSAAINILHERKNDPLFIAALNFLLEDSEDGLNILDDIVDYITSDLWDDLAVDERYCTLPGTANSDAINRGMSTAEYIRKESLLNFTDDLSLVRESFYDNILSSNSKEKKKYIKELAMRKIHVRTILRILFPPHIANELIREGKTPNNDSIDEFEKTIREVLENDHPEVKDYSDAIPISFYDLMEYDDDIEIAMELPLSLKSLSSHRQQAIMFLKEYNEYKNMPKL